MKLCKKKLFVAVFCACAFLAMNTRANADSTTGGVQQNQMNEELVKAEISIPKEEVMNTVSIIIANGAVEGDGVRLRKKPSSSAAVLELMYNGEGVFVDISESVKKNGVLWYNIRRAKTGTWGYTNSAYIDYYDR